MDKDHILAFLKDRGILCAFIVCVLYLIVLRPWEGNLTINENKYNIFVISVPICFGLFAFIYTIISHQKDITKNTISGFFALLNANRLVDEILWLNKWSVYISFSAIVFTILFNLLVNSKLLDNNILGILIIAPLFFVIWAISEIGYYLDLSRDINNNNLEYNRRNIR